MDAAINPAASRPLNTDLAMAGNNAPPVEQVIDGMLSVLEAYLPVPVLNVPIPTVTIRSVTEKPLAIGNDRGLEQRGLLGMVSLKGGRLDALVRFQIWASDPIAADAAMQTLQGQILTDRLNLQAQGFLQLKVQETTLSEHIEALSVWRTSSDLKVLYEFHYDDTDGAESIIARIPIHSDPEARNSADRETHILTDAIVRWDDESASALSITGGATMTTVNGLASLSYAPGGWSGGAVTLSRLERNNAAPPTTYPDLADFVAAVTDAASPDLHAQVVFPDVTEFLALFTMVGDPIRLGDWDEDGVQDLYQSSTLGFSPPILLEGSNAMLQLAYQDPVLNSKAVMYLRGSASNS
jgi:hypothetical protein